MRAFKHRKVLVLNKHSVAVAVVSLRRAVIMLTDAVAPKALVIETTQGSTVPVTWAEWSETRPEEGEDAMHSAHGTYRIPQIIKLNKYDKMPNQKIHFSRRTIFKRDVTCQYCRKKTAISELSIDHVHPRSMGGQTTWENCVASCVYCNKCKADRVPIVKRELVNGKLTTVYIVSFRDGTKTWTVHLPQPKKPEYNFFRGDIHYESWKDWISEQYWTCELENDNPK